MNKLEEYYSQKPNIIVERFKFYDCVKSETETMSQYLARLSVLQNMLFWKSLSETNLTYAKTVKLASAMELAQQVVDCVSGGTVTKLKPDILKFSPTKQHNKSNQHRKHSVSNKQTN